MSKPVVLVLGGVGFIGRNLVKLLIDEDLASEIVVADKRMKETSHFHPVHLAAFEDGRVAFKQADLSRSGSVDKVFALRERFDVVVNCAGHTRFGDPPGVYERNVTKLSALCGAKAAEMGARFIELSTAQIYKAQSRAPAAEDAELAPWTLQAAAKAAAETRLREVDGLDWVLLRPAVVYGEGDVYGLMPRAVCAAAYVQLGETMKFLWEASLRINTVHVVDVCRAVAHCFPRPGGVPSGAVFNLCDRNDTDQGKVNELLSSIFGIRTGFVGYMLSNVARVNLAGVLEAANEKHLAPWNALCREHGIAFSPLTSSQPLELFQHNHLYIDGTAIEGTGFEYAKPTVTEEGLGGMVTFAVDQGIFPPVFGGQEGKEEAKG
uniref:NAD-dependent epimerase/dehydratase domain-containing protein n=1 Tax=Phaeomonas parva TaxID=124430 RepID=A0A7S1TTI4_9STRA|mmetsp:Transcript_17208/g.52815  ORF Transcript_17208/g.52815 Transcript_17208/m.52815 type:complete len:378 (+) Transcript_17208:73-1206(+)